MKLKDPQQLLHAYFDYYIFLKIQTTVGGVSKGQKHISNGRPVFARYGVRKIY